MCFCRHKKRMNIYTVCEWGSGRGVIAAALTNICMTKILLTRRTVSVAALKIITISSECVLLTHSPSELCCSILLAIAYQIFLFDCNYLDTNSNYAIFDAVHLFIKASILKILILFFYLLTFAYLKWVDNTWHKSYWL